MFCVFSFWQDFVDQGLRMHASQPCREQTQKWFDFIVGWLLGVAVVEASGYCFGDVARVILWDEVAHEQRG